MTLLDLFHDIFCITAVFYGHLDLCLTSSLIVLFAGQYCVLMRSDDMSPCLRYGIPWNINHGLPSRTPRPAGVDNMRMYHMASRSPISIFHDLRNIVNTQTKTDGILTKINNTQDVFLTYNILTICPKS